MVMLSSRGVSEISPINEADLKQFDLTDQSPVEETPNTTTEATYGPSPLLDVIRQWAEMQRQSFELLAMAFVHVPPGLSVVTSSGPAKSYNFPPEVLGKPLDNLLVSDDRIGIPNGLVKILNENGIQSMGMLFERYDAGEITKLPRVGKAKAALLIEILRAFRDALKQHQDE